MAKISKETKCLLATVKAAGWIARDIKGGWMLLSPCGRYKVTIHGTNSDHRAIKNTIAELRRSGLKI